MLSVAAFAATPDGLYVWQSASGINAPKTPFTMENGQERTLADFKGQVVLVNLWATWCTPCLKELPTLDALEERYAADGLVVVPLSLDTFDFKQLRGFVEKASLQLPHLAQDKGGAYARALVKRGVPVTYLVDREGVLLWRYDGSTDWTSATQREKIEALLAKPERR